MADLTVKKPTPASQKRAFKKYYEKNGDAIRKHVREQKKIKYNTDEEYRQTILARTKAYAIKKRLQLDNEAILKFKLLNPFINFDVISKSI